MPVVNGAALIAGRRSGPGQMSLGPRGPLTAFGARIENRRGIGRRASRTQGGAHPTRAVDSLDRDRPTDNPVAPPAPAPARCGGARPGRGHHRWRGVGLCRAPDAIRLTRNAQPTKHAHADTGPGRRRPPFRHPHVLARRVDEVRGVCPHVPAARGRSAQGPGARDRAGHPDASHVAAVARRAGRLAPLRSGRVSQPDQVRLAVPVALVRRCVRPGEPALANDHSGLAAP